jgi:hypothetical protein
MIKLEVFQIYTCSLLRLFQCGYIFEVFSVLLISMISSTSSTMYPDRLATLLAKDRAHHMTYITLGPP